MRNSPTPAPSFAALEARLGTTDVAALEQQSALHSQLVEARETAIAERRNRAAGHDAVDVASRKATVKAERDSLAAGATLQARSPNSGATRRPSGSSPDATAQHGATGSRPRTGSARRSLSGPRGGSAAACRGGTRAGHPPRQAANGRAERGDRRGAGSPPQRTLYGARSRRAPLRAAQGGLRTLCGTG